MTSLNLSWIHAPSFSCQLSDSHIFFSFFFVLRITLDFDQKSCVGCPRERKISKMSLKLTLRANLAEILILSKKSENEKIEADNLNDEFGALSRVFGALFVTFYREKK